MNQIDELWRWLLLLINQSDEWLWRFVSGDGVVITIVIVYLIRQIFVKWFCCCWNIKVLLPSKYFTIFIFSPHFNLLCSARKESRCPWRPAVCYFNTWQRISIHSVCHSSSGSLGTDDSGIYETISPGKHSHWFW